jgi:hypothetical protein
MDWICNTHGEDAMNICYVKCDKPGIVQNYRIIHIYRNRYTILIKTPDKTIPFGR